MIQLIKKHTVPAPSILEGKGIAERASLCGAFNGGQIEFEFDSSLYGHAEVKSSLIAVQDGKCCFCESKITHISYGDVEHFRPKAGWIQGYEPLNKPGYYWLAYDWDNLFFACQICNQRHKKNYFPLFDNTKRALSHRDDIDKEAAFFIKPDREDPQDFIEFREEIPFPVDNNPRGTETIQRFGLDRETLSERRREKLGLIRELYNIAKDIPFDAPELKDKAVTLIKRRAAELTADNAEYAAMFRAFFRNNPVNF
jgi:uncharacterized protein (TIGR02646 family)